jgi:hypothetical protein
MDDREGGGTMDEQLSTKLRQARALIELAEHPNTPAAESEAARAKADALIYQYKLDSLLAAGVGKIAAPQLMPQWAEWEVAPTSSEFYQQYYSIASMCITHVDAKGAFESKYRASYEEEGGQYWRFAHICGYESDLMFAELLWTSARAEFSRRLEPKIDLCKSDREKAYVLRHAGLEGRRIAEILWGENTKANRSKARRYFEEEARKRGEDPRPLMGTNSVKVYRETYAEAFTSELYWRLTRMRRERAMEANAIVLAGAQNAVDEMFYERFPTLRPKTAIPWTDPTQNCERCKKAKSGYCREHSYMKPRKEKEKQVNWTAYDRGRDAARAVDLGPGGRRKVEGGDTPRGMLT